MAILFVAIGVLSFLYGYVGWRLLPPLNLVQPWKLLAWIVLFVVAMLPLVSVALRFNKMETAINDLISWLGYISLGFVSLLFFLLVLKDLFWLLGFVIKKTAVLFPSAADSNVVSQLIGGEGRRDFLWRALNYAILGAAGVMTGVGYLQARHRIRQIRVTLPIPGLPAELEGLRLVQISDIHVGPTIKGGFVREIVHRVNRLNPDMIMLTGDLVDGSVTYLADDVQPLINLNARHGKFFVTGNHEYYSGVHQWIKKVRELGFDVLLNEHRLFEGPGYRMIIGGVTDIRADRMIPGHRSDPVASLAGAPESDLKILLAHQPISVYEAAKAGYDIQLSGHTHGGQYFPFSRLVKLQQPFLAGLYKHEKTWVYVNRGTGYWGPPLRIGPPAEITELILTGRRKDPLEEEL